MKKNSMETLVYLDPFFFLFCLFYESSKFDHQYVVHHFCSILEVALMQKLTYMICKYKPFVYAVSLPKARESRHTTLISLDFGTHLLSVFLYGAVCV